MKRKPDFGLRSTLAAAIASQRAQWDDIFPRWTAGGTSDPVAGDPRTVLHQIAAPTLVSIYAATQAALDAMTETAIEVTRLQGLHRQYTPEYLAAQLAERKNQGMHDYANSIASATAGIDGLSREFVRGGVPTRPQPADAAQEGALQNLRADLRMALDRHQPDVLPQLLADMAGDAAQRGDQLRLWFLASTPWPSDYLISREAEHAVPQMPILIGEAIKPFRPRSEAQALAAYKLLEDGRQAVRRNVDTLLPAIFEFEMDALNEPYDASAGR